jgi:hypothetical protein
LEFKKNPLEQAVQLLPVLQAEQPALARGMEQFCWRQVRAKARMMSSRNIGILELGMLNDKLIYYPYANIQELITFTIKIEFY